jgi:hypothetical protein
MEIEVLVEVQRQRGGRKAGTDLATHMVLGQHQLAVLEAIARHVIAGRGIAQQGPGAEVGEGAAEVPALCGLRTQGAEREGQGGAQSAQMAEGAGSGGGEAGPGDWRGAG